MIKSRWVILFYSFNNFIEVSQEMPENTNGNPLGGQPNGKQPQEGNPTNSNPQAGEDSKDKDKNQNLKDTYTKEEYERLQRNKHESDNEARNLRARLKAIEAEKEEAEQKRLSEQGEFKTLYEQEQAKVKELEPVLDENKFLRDYAMRQLDSTIEDWPDEVKAFDPGKKAPLQERLAWLEKGKLLVAKLQGPGVGSANRGGNSYNPRPAGQVGPKTADDYYKEFKASGKI